MRRYLDRSPIVAFIDRKTAGKFAGKTLIVLLGIFIGLIVLLWWWQVIKFFLYDHWKPTVCVIACCLAWYAIGLALEQFDRRVRRLHFRRHADPNYYGDDDCA
jgi:hypothetical protein